MSQLQWQLLNGQSLVLTVVASDPVWLGAVKRAALLPRANRPRCRVDVVPSLAGVARSSLDKRELLLVEVDRSSVVETAQWLERWRPFAATWRVAILLSRSRGEFSPSQASSAAKLLVEAGASHVITTIWEVPPVVEWGLRFLGEGPLPSPWARLPVPLTAPGWQPTGRRV
jgi:hypothetical protein